MVAGPAKVLGRAMSEITRDGLAKMLAREIDSLWLRLLAWHMRRTNQAILCSLDDRALHDIGLHRSAIEAAVRGIDSTLARRKRAAVRLAGRSARAAGVVSIWPSRTIQGE